MDERVIDTAGPANLALSFNNLTVTSQVKQRKILNNVCGYVERGGITAVLGPSASGKSILLKALAGRLQEFEIIGEVTMNGSIVNPKKLDNPVAYVPQGDSLIGELTAREVTTDSATFKLVSTQDEIKAKVANLLDSLGLSRVADGIIGTILFRGLSGGEKRRVEISTELIASPAVLLMDEPTSGLDASISFDVLSAVRKLVKESNGSFSCVLTIHQPNSKILQLFDHLLLLDHGESYFFGTLSESLNYFQSICYPCPTAVTPVDHYLQISDKNFSPASSFDFVTAFNKSQEKERLQIRIQNSLVTMSSCKSHPESPGSWMQLQVLTRREFTLAYRDPMLYYFQVALMCGFGFCVGAVFFQLPQTINGNFNIFPGVLLWITLMNGWAHAFKVFHISKNDIRTQHEIANNKYGPVTQFVADTFSVSLLTCGLIPVGVISYFMAGLPGNAYPFLILNYWVTSLASEAMLAFITKFSHSATVSMIFCQMALVVLMVFGGGVFIPWKDCPKYWIWVQETSLFTQSSRAAILQVMDHMSFTCNLSTEGVCIDPGTLVQYECVEGTSNGSTCLVAGREIIYVTQGIGQSESYWVPFAWLCCILVAYKLCILALTIYPWERIQYSIIKVFVSPKTAAEVPKLSNHSGSSAVHCAVNVDVETQDVTVVQSVEPAALEMSVPSLIMKSVSVILKKNGKMLVDSVSAMVTCGRVLALMGPSGAGKTTLLNALARRAKYARVTGEVTFAGRPFEATDLTYVPQFDDPNEILTIQEHLQFVGSLSCNVSDQVLKQRMSDLLEVLGLTSKKDVAVKDLTGGEKKRVSIGIGMISSPNILFLDEPTTGLDSTAAYSIVKYLAAVAKATQVAVILTIHQPSALVFDMLDDLLLLERGGRVIYTGTIQNARSYFASVGFDNPDNINPADYYLELAQNPPNENSSWTDLFNGSPSHQQYDRLLTDALANGAKKPPTKPPSAAFRFGILLRYFFSYDLKQRVLYEYRLYSLIVIGIFSGTLFFNLQTTTDQIQLYVGAIIFVAIACMITAASATGVYAKDRFEAVDRISNGVFTPGIFVASQSIAAAFYCLCLTFVFVSIFHWLTNINPDTEVYGYDVLINWGHLMLMESFLHVMLEILKNDFLTVTTAMIFVGCNMAFAGFFRAVEQIPAWINWMCYIVPLRWSFQGFVWQVFNNQNFSVPDTSPPYIIPGSYILRAYFDLSNVNSWGMFGALMGYVLLFRIVQYLLLAWQTEAFSKSE